MLTHGFDYFQTIVFIRDKNARGQEISGYIDYAHRLKTEDFEPYFSGKKRLLPRPSDLRYISRYLKVNNLCLKIQAMDESFATFLKTLTSQCQI